MTAPAETQPAQFRRLGLVGGLGVGATILYYRELVQAHAALGRPANLFIAHADTAYVLGLIGAGKRAELAEYLARLMRELKAGGAEIAALTGIAPHICSAELTPLLPLQFVNIVDEIALHLKAAGLACVTLFGTRTAMQSRLFGRLAGIEVILPPAEQIDLIHTTYMQIVESGAGNAGQRQLLTGLARQLIAEAGAQSVVLAGTELSLLWDQAPPDFPHVDGARLHIAAIMRALGAAT